MKKNFKFNWYAPIEVNPTEKKTYLYSYTCFEKRFCPGTVLRIQSVE